MAYNLMPSLHDKFMSLRLKGMNRNSQEDRAYHLIMEIKSTDDLNTTIFLMKEYLLTSHLLDDKDLDFTKIEITEIFEKSVFAFNPRILEYLLGAFSTREGITEVPTLELNPQKIIPFNQIEWIKDKIEFYKNDEFAKYYYVNLLFKLQKKHFL